MPTSEQPDARMHVIAEVALAHFGHSYALLGRVHVMAGDGEAGMHRMPHSLAHQVPFGFTQPHFFRAFAAAVF